MSSRNAPLSVGIDGAGVTEDDAMPRIEIFVWDAGLGLPSIEPECIAILAYLKRHERDLPAHSVAVGNEPSLTPAGDYPYMRCSADICHDVCITGFDQIVAHLNTEHFYDYPSPQDRSQTAQDTASVLHGSNPPFSALTYYHSLSVYISSKGRQLLDLYLYVSYDNYYSTTSASWTAILPWYENYVTPPAKRRAAQARTEHLGVTSLDVDNVHDMPLTGRRLNQNAASPAVKAVGSNSAAATMIAESERRKRIQVLDKAAHSDVFRLRRLAEPFFGALDAKVKRQLSFPLGAREARSVEYLMLGYLSIIKYAPAANKWLADILIADYPDLASWTGRFLEQSFDRSPEGGPWPRQQHRIIRKQVSFSIPFRVIGHAILQKISVISLFASPEIVASSPAGFGKAKTTMERILHAQRTSIWQSASAIILTISMAAALVIVNDGFWYDIVKFELGSSLKWFRPRLSRSSKAPSVLADMGEAGGFLSVLGQQMHFEANAVREQERLGGATIAAFQVAGTG